MKVMVARDGLEPPTRGFSILEESQVKPTKGGLVSRICDAANLSGRDGYS
jgi:hypothetical protein